MCGFVGYVELGFKSSEEEHLFNINRMNACMVHRGPDDSGIWIDPSAGIALGHRRLSIIDLSQEGHQPMVSQSGRFVIVYNGEVFNYRHIAEELKLEGVRFKGHSDTEVVLEAIEKWGVRNSVLRFVGMFAFAIWDKKQRFLYLIRDRLGIKPIYYGWINGTLFFGSELKAFKKHPSFVADIDRCVVALYLKYGYVPAPYSIFKSIEKLSPGHIRCFKFTTGESCEEHEEEYWSLSDVVSHNRDNLVCSSEKETISRLEALLKEAVGLRMIADVPLGAFLSGGIDSSIVVALMQSQSRRSVKTFSIGFHEEHYNEASHAKKVAEHLCTDHTELYVTPSEARNVIPILPCIYDEPFADPSQIPTYLVSKLARQYVKVSLSGDGGDELFGGYTRYLLGKSIWNKIGWMPRFIRKGMANAITSLPVKRWDGLFELIEPIVPKRVQQSRPGEKLYKLAEVLAHRTSDDMYKGLVSHWKEPHNVVISASEPETALTNRKTWAKLPDFTQRMMYIDLISYLPDDILVKVDRASMGVSLEARVPLLDHRLVEFAWRLPLSLKIKGGKSKWPLRQVLYKYVPKKMIERPKMGFGIPIDSWLRGPLREWADSLLDEKRIETEGFFNPEPIRQKWEEHLSGSRNWQYHLWDALMFQAWLEAEKLTHE